MRLYIDNDVEAWQVKLLREQGHDVYFVQEQGKEITCASDEFHARTADAEKRILITKDRDYTALRELERIPSSGVVYIRGDAADRADYAERLSGLIKDHEAELERGDFLTLGITRVKVREFEQAKTRDPEKPETLIQRLRRPNTMTAEQLDAEKRRLETQREEQTRRRDGSMDRES